MEQVIVDVLKIQRNEAMDTIAVLNGHLAETRAELAALKAANAVAGECAGATDAQTAADSYHA